MNITPRTNIPNMIPYGHHYKCAAQMVGSPVNQSVFQYLLDSYIYRLKSNQNVTFKLSVNDISAKRNIAWQTASDSIENLQTMGLIEIDGNDCTVKGDVFVSLIHAFYELKTTPDKKRFIKALQQGDYCTLEDLGYSLVCKSSQELFFQKGDVSSKISDSIEVSSKISYNPSESSKISYKSLFDERESSKISENLMLGSDKVLRFLISSKISENLLLQEVVSSKISYNSDEGSKISYNFDESSKKCENFLALSSKISYNLSDIENLSKPELLRFLRGCCETTLSIIPCFIEEIDFFSYFGSEFNDKEGEIAIQMIFYSQIEVFDIETVVKTTDKVLRFLRSGLSEILEVVLRNLRTVDKEDKKEDKSGSAPSGNIGENKKEQENNIEVDLSSYKQQKQKSLLPFFPVEEVENFISSLANCFDRADKIFINQLWEIATSLVGWEESQGEDGSITELPVNIEGEIIYADRIMQDLLLPAYEATEEIIQRGFVVVNGETIATTTNMIDPDDVQKILDWECVTVEGIYQAYKISKSRLHNIQATPVTINKRQSSRQSRVEDKEYMQKIVLIGEDDDLYSQLTPIELAIYNFLTTHFQLSDHGEIVAPLTEYINRVQLSQFYVTLREAGLSEKDFLSVLFKNKPDKRDGSLQLKDRMFDSSQISKWNAIHAHFSTIDSFLIPPYRTTIEMPVKEA